MYAVIKTGGKQYRVAEGDVLKVESLAEVVDSKIEFDQVLMVANGDDIKVGKPLIEGGKVSASVVSHGRGKKIRIVKFRRRKDSGTETGHRQNFTEIRIDKIAG